MNSTRSVRTQLNLHIYHRDQRPPLGINNSVIKLYQQVQRTPTVLHTALTKTPQNDQ